VADELNTSRSTQASCMACRRLIVPPMLLSKYARGWRRIAYGLHRGEMHHGMEPVPGEQPRHGGSVAEVHRTHSTGVP
jgi:hypothetical protein